MIILRLLLYKIKERGNMINLEGRLLGNRYQIIEKIGNGRHGNSLQSGRQSA